MQNLNLWLKGIRQFERKKTTIQSNSPIENAGFTLIELLVVVVLMGVIAAIAAPGWLSFVNQRRANAVNDYIFRALQEAQSQAKHKKVSYSVSVRMNNNVPEVAVYPTKTPDPTNTTTTKDVDPLDTNFKYWKSLDGELAIKPGQVLLGTNLDRENSATATGSSSFPPPTNTPIPKITFDYMGALPTGADVDPPLTIVTAIPAGNSNNPIASTKRCVQVRTILGSISIGRGQYDATSNLGGCR